jgi:hypothetical protein
MHSGTSSAKAKVTVPAVPVSQYCSILPLQKKFCFIKPDGDDLRNFIVRPWLLFFLFLFFTFPALSMPVGKKMPEFLIPRNWKFFPKVAPFCSPCVTYRILIF